MTIVKENNVLGVGTRQTEKNRTDSKIKEMDLVKEPNPPFPVEIVDVKPVEVKNPFSGEKTILQPTAVAVYDCIKGAEMFQEWDIVRKGLDWFMDNYPKAYMILLD